VRRPLRAVSVVVACAAGAVVAGACGDGPSPGVIVRSGEGEGGEGEGEGEGGEGEGEGEGGEGEGEGEGEGGEGEGEGEGDAPPARYGAGDVSPLSTSVRARLRALRAAHPALQDDVFAKIGDSNTVNTGFLTCFDGGAVDLASHDDDRTLESTRAFFSGGDAAGASPWDRVSASATVGWSAFHPLAGNPRPLDVEIDAIAPGLALVMFGTNDIQFANLTRYADDMLTLTDALLARGVIPVVSTIPPRDDSATADAAVPRYNLVARAIAESRQVPFLDLERRLRPLADHGLGGDGLHLTSDPRGACRFDATGLTFGQNVRNLLTLQALRRVHAATTTDADVPFVADDPGPGRLGSGAVFDPFVVDVLPFTGAADTRDSDDLDVTAWDCAPTIDESGPAQHWRVTLAAPATLHALVFDQGDVDVDVHVVKDGDCLARNDREVTLALAAGTYDIVMDTFAGGAQAGPYHVVVYTE
jgi:hypothetical protein